MYSLAYYLSNRGERVEDDQANLWWEVKAHAVSYSIETASLIVNRSETGLTR
jgi:hypothetical protein